MKRRDLGRHLEWHGDRIRVVMKVPPSQRAEFGTKVREVLITRDQLEAEREKLDVIRRIKAKLKGVKTLATQKPLIEEALRWRQAAQDEAVATGLTDEQTTVAEALSNRVARIEAIHGPQEAQQFAAVASGTGNTAPRLARHLVRGALFHQRIPRRCSPGAGPLGGLLSALSGLRIDEIGSLRVKDC